jgi:hypothetical protein
LASIGNDIRSDLPLSLSSCETLDLPTLPDEYGSSNCGQINNNRMKPTARANEDREGNMDICELQVSTACYNNDDNDDEEEEEKEDYRVQYEQFCTDERRSPYHDGHQQNRQAHTAAAHPGVRCHPIPCDCHHKTSRQ